MMMLFSRIKMFSFTVVLLAVLPASVFGEDPKVSIYRDFDDGLFGRSLYRGVVFSVKLDSFQRYETLPVKDMDGAGTGDGLTAYLCSGKRAADLAAGRGDGITVLDGNNREYLYEKDGIRVQFSLESAPEDLYEEIRESYKSGYVIRIHRAENVYRPQYSGIDYEDVLISASLIGDSFQPLWGIHDGADITALFHLCKSSCPFCVPAVISSRQKSGVVDMKSTDLARRDREIKKARKREMVLERKGQRESRTPGDYINEFTELFFYDDEKIYNIEMSEDILILLEEMKEELPEKQWPNVIRKSVKKTKVKQKDLGITQLAGMGDIDMSFQ